jgi:hypothetical protein
VRKARKSQKRNLALLSFGEDAEQEEAAAAAPAKIKWVYISQLVLQCCWCVVCGGVALLSFGEDAEQEKAAAAAPAKRSSECIL